MKQLVKLKPKRQRFVDEYMIDFNITKAAIRAGYSDYTAPQLGQVLFTNIHVKAEIERRKEEYKKKYEIKREYIVEKLFKLIQDSESDSDRATLVKSLDMLNKMSGQYVSTQVNYNVDVPLFPEEDE